jgi:hypothetical protein
VRKLVPLFSAFVCLASTPVMANPRDDTKPESVKPAGKPEAAQTLLDAALKKAKAQKKAVFVIFDASW